MIDFPGVYETPGAGEYEMSALLSECGNFAEALDHIDQAMEQSRPYVNARIDSTTTDVGSIFYAKVITLRCQCLAGLGRFSEALRDSAPFVGVYADWERRHLEGSTADLAALHSDRSEWLHECGFTEQAVQEARAAVTRFSRLAANVSGIYRPDCAEALRRLAEYAFELDPESVGAELDECFAYEQVTGHPAAQLPRAGDEALRAAKKLVRRDEKDPAEEHLNFATAHYIRLFADNYHWGTDLTTAYYFHLTLRLGARRPNSTLLDPSRRALECARIMFDADANRHRETYQKVLQWRIHALEVNGMQREALQLQQTANRLAHL
ncbi:hypothetical protein [Haloglycomyces albus]|uniref:hypothetical protein n=1 Tax=Haloglycomyces albus TaxID=526067 RepID=UPI00046CAE06|nr:hypothetical protein [Haloglycomyces albus]